MTVADNTLGLLLANSPVRILILNGRTVVDRFEDIAGMRLKKRRMRAWSLPRHSGPDVPGISYRGVVAQLAEIDLRRELLQAESLRHNSEARP